jgi:Tol biopolymer transport system component
MKKISLLITVTLILAFGAGVAVAQSGYDLFQKALVKERAEGNIEEAIQLYQHIVREFAEDRVLTAKALVQMGQCYEKLGKAEARKTYQQVLRDYADQRKQVAIARARLAAITQPASSATTSGMVARQVWAGPEVRLRGSVSPDGRYLTSVERGTGNLIIRDIAAGENRSLTDKTGWTTGAGSEYASGSIFSPDGKQVAYTWFSMEKFPDTGDVSYELRIINLDGSGMRRLYRNQEISYVEPHGWTPDGRWILALSRTREPSYQIVFISTQDGSVRVLKSLNWRRPRRLSLSPDGKSVVYDFPPREDSSKRDIFLLAADGTREVPLVKHAANDLNPIWTPDGNHVLFISDRTGRMGLWAIKVAADGAVGSAQLVKSDVGQGSPLGFSPEGGSYYGVGNGERNIYMATLEPATANLLSQPVSAAETYMGANSAPEWSADGKSFAYISQRSREQSVVVIRNLQTGAQREFTPDTKIELSRLLPRRRLRWSPDGSTLLASGRSRKGREGGIYRIDIETGAASFEGPGKFAEWSPDGKGFFYRGSGPENTLLFYRNLETGRTREIHRVLPPDHLGPFIVSPDGRQIVVHEGGANGPVLKVIPAEGGEPRELYRGPHIDHALAWTPDGRHILFGSLDLETDPDVGSTELWRIPISGGSPERVGLAKEGKFHDLRISPDGRRLAFTAEEPSDEVWVLENFLPALKAKK